MEVGPPFLFLEAFLRMEEGGPVGKVVRISQCSRRGNVESVFHWRSFNFFLASIGFNSPRSGLSGETLCGVLFWRVVFYPIGSIFVDLGLLRG